MMKMMSLQDKKKDDEGKAAIEKLHETQAQ